MTNLYRSAAQEIETKDQQSTGTGDVFSKYKYLDKCWLGRRQSRRRGNREGRGTSPFNIKEGVGREKKKDVYLSLFINYQ